MKRFGLFEQVLLGLAVAVLVIGIGYQLTERHAVTALTEDTMNGHALKLPWVGCEVVNLYSKGAPSPTLPFESNTSEESLADAHQYYMIRNSDHAAKVMKKRLTALKEDYSKVPADKPSIERARTMPFLEKQDIDLELYFEKEPHPYRKDYPDFVYIMAYDDFHQIYVELNRSVR